MHDKLLFTATLTYIFGCELWVIKKGKDGITRSKKSKERVPMCRLGIKEYKGMYAENRIPRMVMNE